jgi:hypothetical protein
MGEYQSGRRHSVPFRKFVIGTIEPFCQYWTSSMYWTTEPGAVDIGITVSPKLLR